MKKIENILQYLKLTKQKYEKVAEANGERFNVFSLIKLETNEVRTHSKLIAELLSPNGSHSQNSIFLRLFLEQLGIDFLSDELDEFKVEIEKTIYSGRIDILIQNKNKCIIIENKIYAGDQKEQLERYYLYAKSKATAISNIEILYLTLDGSEPKKYTLGNLEKNLVRPLSYQNEIIEWLERCIKEVARVPQVREIIFQYQQLLKKLTGQTTNKRFIMEAKSIFYKDGNYQVIQDLEHAIDEFKTEVQFQFWEELRELLIEKKVISSAEVNHVDRSSVKKYYQRYSSGKYYYGLSFDLPIDVENTYRIAFKVEIKNTIKYGFRISKPREGHCAKCKNKPFLKYCDIIQQIPIIGTEFKNTQWWLGYKHSKKDFNFAHFNNEVIYGLIKDNTRKTLINELADEISLAISGFINLTK